MTPDQIKALRSDYEEIPAAQSGKRCGMQWTPWMDDWFTSWSPRNDNHNAEGPWAHWVDLALRILQDPLTQLVRPDAADAVKELEQRDFYSEADRYLTNDELVARFTTPPGASS